MKLSPLLLGLALILALSPATRRVHAAEATPADTRHRLTVAADRPDAIYRRGDTVTFHVRLERDGQPLSPGEVQWTITKDGLPPSRAGLATIDRGQATITGTLDEAGFLQCRVACEIDGVKLSALAGAAISPADIKPSAPPPDDFDAFWNAQKKRLATVPIKARLTPVPSSDAKVEAFDLQADCIGAPASGYYARPVGARVRSRPAILTVHGAGVRSASLPGTVSWAREGAIALDLNAHGLPNGRDAAYYAALAAGELKDYRVSGRDSRDTIYFLGMFLRLLRAIDFLAEQPEWDGRTLVVFGSSQGGAQALAAAGLDRRVSFFVAGVPAMCDHTGFLANRVSGWPKFVPSSEKNPPPAVTEAIRYYDAVNFASRIRAPGLLTVGFIDTTCPPTGVYAAYNALRSPKEIFHDIAAGHTNTPAASAAMRAAVKRHFAAMR